MYGTLHESNRHNRLNLGMFYTKIQQKEMKVFSGHLALNSGYTLHLKNKLTLGSGLYVGNIQSGIDFNDARWLSQYDGTKYNPALPSLERFTSTTLYSNGDVGAGIHLRYASKEFPQKKYFRILKAFAVYHLFSFTSFSPNYDFDYGYIPRKYSLISEMDWNWFSYKLIILHQKPLSSINFITHFNLFISSYGNCFKFGFGIKDYTTIFQNIDNLETAPFAESGSIFVQFDTRTYSVFFSYEDARIYVRQLDNNKIKRMRIAYLNTFEIGLQYHISPANRKPKVIRYDKKLNFYE